MALTRPWLLSLVLAASVSLAFGSSATGANLTRIEASLLEEMNEVRAARRLPTLRVDRALRRAARAHSRHMLRHGYFAHGQFGRRVTAFGLRGPTIGENLAWAPAVLTDADRVVRAWLASPHHRSNLLRPGFRRVGIGALVGPFGAHERASLITADFAGV